MSEMSEASAVRRSWWGDGGGKGSEERGETFGKSMAGIINSTENPRKHHPRNAKNSISVSL